MNPFYVTGIIPPAYFCDRETETDWLVRTVTNQANVLLLLKMLVLLCEKLSLFLRVLVFFLVHLFYHLIVFLFSLL